MMRAIILLSLFMSAHVFGESPELKIATGLAIDGLNQAEQTGTVTCSDSIPVTKFRDGCPDFLAQEMLNDRDKPFSIWKLGTDASTQQACTSIGEGIFQPIVRDGKVIYEGTNSNELEQLLSSHEDYKLGLKSNHISRCLDTNAKYSKLNQIERSVLVSEYYTRLNQVKDGGGALLTEIHEIDSLVPTESSDEEKKEVEDLTAEGSPIPGIHDLSKTLKKCDPNQSSKFAKRNQKFAGYVTEHESALKELVKLNKDMSDGFATCMFRGTVRNTGFCKNEWPEKKKKIDSLRTLIKDAYPALASSELKDLSKSTKEANVMTIHKSLSNYLTTRRTQAINELKEMEGHAKCLNGTQSNCDYDKFSAKLAKVQTVEEPYPGNLNDRDKINKETYLDRNFANAAHGMLECRLQHRKIVAGQHETFTNAAVDIGLTIATAGIGAVAGAGRIAAAGARGAMAGKNALQVYKATREAQFALMAAKSAEAVRKATNVAKAISATWKVGLWTGDRAWSIKGASDSFNDCEENFIIQSSAKSKINQNGCEENSDEQLRLQREHKSCAMSVAFGLLGVLPVAGDILHAGIAAKRAMTAQRKLVGAAEDAMGLGSTVANGANNRPFFYGLYRQSALTTNDQVAKRAMERFKADPGSVVGIIDTAPVKLQSQSDCYLHALYHSPQNRALRDSMTYEEFMFRSNEVLRSNEAANKLVNSKGASIAEVMESFKKSVYSSGVLESEKKILLEAMNKGHMNLSGKGMNKAEDFKKVIQNNEGNPVILALDVDKNNSHAVVLEAVVTKADGSSYAVLRDSNSSTLLEVDIKELKGRVDSVSVFTPVTKESAASLVENSPMVKRHEVQGAIDKTDAAINKRLPDPTDVKVRRELEKDMGVTTKFRDPSTPAE